MAKLADTQLLMTARREAQTLLERDPDLTHPDHDLLRQKMQAFWRKAEGAS
jgi:ATP-dependent DNA helicase RecG